MKLGRDESIHGLLQVSLFLGQICQEVDPGQGKNRSLGGPLGLLKKKFFFRLEANSNKLKV